MLEKSPHKDHEEPACTRQLLIPDSFLEDLATIESQKVVNAILDRLESVVEFPLMGSELVPQSVKNRYGSKARKIVVSTFDIFYTFDPKTQTIEVKALVHRRTVR